jgi:6-phosphofructokinase 1
VAGGADVILIPEIPYHFDKSWRVCASATSAAPASASSSSPKGPADRRVAVRHRGSHGGHAERLGGAAKFCGDELARLTEKETRHVVLGPSAAGPAHRPRSTGRWRLGSEEKRWSWCCGVSSERWWPTTRPSSCRYQLGEVVGRIKLVPLDYDLLQTARMMGISFGD